MDTVSSLIFFLVLGLIVIATFLNVKEPKKYLLAFAIITIPWQGGYWIKFFQLDIRFSYLLVFIVFILLIFYPARGPFSRKIHPLIAIPAVGMIICAIDSSVTAVDFNAAIGGVFVLFLEYLLFYCIINVIKQPRDLKFIIIPILISFCFQSILGIIQFKFTGFKLGIIDQSQSYMWWRAKGTFFHANHFGMFLLLVFPIIFRLLLLAIKIKNIKKIKMYGFLVLIGTLALVATQNRGAWGGLSFGMLSVFFYDFIKKRSRMQKIIIKSIVPVSFFAILLFFKYGNFLINRLFYDDTIEQINGRESLQMEAINLIKLHPLGVGLRNYKNHIHHEFVHNLYLLVASEIGIIGLIFFVLLLFVIFREIKNCIKSKNIYINNIGLALMSSLIGFLVASIPGPDYLISHSVGLQFWILIGLIICLNRFRKQFNLGLLSLTRRNINEYEKHKIIQGAMNQWKSLI